MQGKTRPEPGGLTRSQIDALADTGIIARGKRDEVVAAAGLAPEWQGWAARWATGLGGTFLLFGIVLFFAWNWKGMSPLLRFGTLGAGVAASAIAAAAGGANPIVRQAGLMAATVLTGVLVAVYGQNFQTGADAFEVFALWAGLSLAWVVVSKSAPLWILWLAVLQTALVTFGGQVLVPGGTTEWTSLFAAIGVLMSGVAALREWLAERPAFAWLKAEWIRTTLLTAALGWLSVSTWTLIFERSRELNQGGWIYALGVIAWVAAVAGGAIYHTRFRPSLPAVGVCMLAAAGVTISFAANKILDIWSGDASGWLAVGIIAIAIFAGAASAIGFCARSMARTAAMPTEAAPAP